PTSVGATFAERSLVSTADLRGDREGVGDAIAWAVIATALSSPARSATLIPTTAGRVGPRADRRPQETRRTRAHRPGVRRGPKGRRYGYGLASRGENAVRFHGVTAAHPELSTLTPAAFTWTSARSQRPRARGELCDRPNRRSQNASGTSARHLGDEASTGC